MIMKKLFLLLIIVICARSQDNESNEACRSQTTINNYYSRERTSSFNPSAYQRGDVLQGPPGKLGPKGLKGEKGAQGEPGIRDNDAISKLKRELADVRNQLDLLGPHRSCDYVSASARQGAGMYILINPDPGQVPPFYVYCNFSAATPETVIHHGLMDEMEIDKCEPPFCYKKKVNYNVTVQQIASLIEISHQCRQFIKLRCLGVYLSSHAGWLSRNGSLQTYWGGSTSERPGYCACGETNTCVTGLQCNCNRNSPPETSDEGYLTNKNQLPVTEIQFGDAGHASERGWHTLGPLICSGRQ